MTHILLIDDDSLEEEILRRCVKKLAPDHDITIHHVFKCSGAIDHLLNHKYDLVILDNLLAASISGKFSVPVIKQYLGACPLIIASSDIDVDYLQDPKTLGVDAIIDKQDLDVFMLKFLKSRTEAGTKIIDVVSSSINAA